MLLKLNTRAVLKLVLTGNKSNKYNIPKVSSMNGYKYPQKFQRLAMISYILYELANPSRLSSLKKAKTMKKPAIKWRIHSIIENELKGNCTNKQTMAIKATIRISGL